MKKKIFAFLTVALMTANSVYAADGFWADGELNASVRDVYGELGKEVVWDAETKTAAVDGNIYISQDGIIANGENIGGRAGIIDGRMYVAAELIAKSLGAEYVTENESGIIEFNGARSVINPAPAEETASDFKYGGGKPWPNSNFKENIDTNVSLKDNYDMAVNGKWVLENEIPAGYSWYMTGSEKGLEIEDEIKKLYTDKTLKGKNAEIVQSYYSALLDWDTREGSLDDMGELIDNIDSLQSIEELNEYILYTDENIKYPDSPFLSVYISKDFYNADQYAFGISPNMLILKDAAEYDDMSEYGKRLYEGEKELFGKIMTRLGYEKEESDECFEMALEFEALEASKIPTVEEQYSPDIFKKLYEHTDYETLYKAAGDYPLEEIVKSYGFEGSKSVLEEIPGYTEYFGSIYNEDNFKIIKADMIVNSVLGAADVLDKQTFDDYLDCVEYVNGTDNVSYEQYAIGTVRQEFVEPTAELYLHKYPDKGTKEKVETVCKNVIDEYELMLKENDWLTEKTKQKALEKLRSLKINVAYPDKFRDYSFIDIKGKNLDEIGSELYNYSIEKQREYINGTVDKTYWAENMDPLTINAYYDPTDNSINILYGQILSQYDPSLSDEELYGGLGVVIGHEISHAFDPSGAQFDKDGNFSNWWSEEDNAAFKARTQKLIDFYDKIVPYNGVNCSGTAVQEEAVADLGGMKCIIRIANKMDNCDYDKLFRAYAESWASLLRGESLEYLLKYDTHPLDYLRVNIVLQQFDEFIETYDIKPGDGMYLAPEDRILVW